MNRLDLYNSLPEDYRELVDESVNAGMDFDKAMKVAFQLMAIFDSEEFTKLFMQAFEEKIGG